MQYVSFSVGRYVSFGVLLDGGIHDLGARIGSVIPDLKALLEAQGLGMLRVLPEAKSIDFSDGDFAYLPVIPNPKKILCVGLNYQDHRAETGRAATEHPAIFIRFADTLVGHEAPLELPSVSQAFDFEGELAVVIGKAGYRVSEEDAPTLIAGYSVFNDTTLRDWQRHTPQFTPGKNFPGTGALGPSLTTEIDLTQLADKSIKTLLNGKVMQSARLGDMIFPVARVISYLSGFTRLSPGDVVAMGTPGGVGFKRDPPLYMRLGDEVEVNVEGVGRLLNTVAVESTPPQGR